MPKNDVITQVVMFKYPCLDVLKYVLNVKKTTIKFYKIVEKYSRNSNLSVIFHDNVVIYKFSCSDKYYISFDVLFLLSTINTNIPCAM